MHRPKILGILNITTDSFSDGGQFLTPETALAHARLLTTHSDIIDIGAASSHPDSHPVLAAEEIDRLQAIVPALHKHGTVISVDSFLPETQLWACEQGVGWLNDIQGFADAHVQEVLAQSSCQLFVMHSIQSAGSAQREPSPEKDIWNIIEAFFEQRLEQFNKVGIAHNRVVLDPGMGFFLGNNPETSLQVLANIDRLRKCFNLPVLVSVSRKSFVRAVSGCSIAESGAATLAAELWAAMRGVDYIRTHNPKQLVDGLALQAALQGHSSPDDGCM